MIRFYSLLFSLCLFSSVHGERIANHYEIQDLGRDSKLDGQILIEFEVYDDYDEICNKEVSFKYNQVELKANCNDSLCWLLTDSTNFKCRILKNKTYPVYIKETLKKNHKYRIKVFLQGRRENVRKPVIYVHSSDTIALNIKLTTPCENIFSYPQISTQNEWKIISYPNQTISFNNEEYRYLFWDGELNINEFDGFLTKASIIESDSLLPYLNNSLNGFGFNSQEKADFITYWYPLMQSYAGVQVQFLYNEDVQMISKLDNDQALPVYQFYMIWSPIYSSAKIKSNYPDKIIPQINVPNDYILEWGGIELNQNNFEYENEF